MQPGPWSADQLGDGEGGVSDCQRGAQLNRRDGAPSAERMPYVGTHLRLPTAMGFTNVQQYVMTFPDAAAAARSLAAHAEALRACRTEEVTERESDPPLEVLSVATHDVVLDSADRLMVRTTFACATCGADPTYLLVVQRGARLAVVSIFGADGVPPALAEALPDTVAQRLAAPA